MLYTIENDQIRVQVSSCGAELQSIVLKADGTEYLWQGDPAYWAKRAPSLFPICGRLWEGCYTYRGKTYEMNLHGFVKMSEMAACRQQADQISFRLLPNAEILAQYPFQFALTITHTLVGASVMTSFHVENHDEKDMRFTLGGHPGFQVPMGGEGTFEDCYLEFDQAADVKMMNLSPDCFLTEGFTPLKLEEGKILPLRHSLFDNDALVLFDVCRAVTIKSRASARQVRLEFPQMPYLGLWHTRQSEAPFVCMEPWCGVPSQHGVRDDLETKRDLFCLPGGETYENGYVISIK